MQNRILEKKLLQTSTGTTTLYFFGENQIEEAEINAKVQTYCKNKLAGKTQYQLYVSVELASNLTVNDKVIQTVKFFEGTIENEMLPVKNEYISPYGVHGTRITFVQKNSALDDGSNDDADEDFLASIDEDNEEDELVDEAEPVQEKRYYTNVYIGKWTVLGYGYTGTVKEFKTAMEAFNYLKAKEARYSKKTRWVHEIFNANNEDEVYKHKAEKIYWCGTGWYQYEGEGSTIPEIQALIDAEKARKFESDVSVQAEIDKTAEVSDTALTFPVVADQFAALELADDYFPKLNISGKLTKSNGVLTAINENGVKVTIHDDHLEIDSENGTWRIEYDIAETVFCRALRELTAKTITEGKMQDTFEIVGKSGLIYTYTESTLKPVLTETQEQHDARINSAPKITKKLDVEDSVKVKDLWKILRQKQQALKAIMAEKNIVAARKYSVKIAEIKFLVDAINALTKTAAA